MSDTKLTTGCGSNDCAHGQEVPVSEKIRARLVADNVQFHCNDNISKYVSEEERALLVDEVTEKMEAVLRSLVIDTDHDHNTNGTARRVAKMYVNETYGGRYVGAPKITSFPNVGYQDLYTAPFDLRAPLPEHRWSLLGWHLPRGQGHWTLEVQPPGPLDCGASADSGRDDHADC